MTALNTYEQKLEDRRTRLERAAERAADASTAAYQSARNATDGIVFGQPILVGHHSEGRHRSALKRSDNAMRRSVALSTRAEELSARAESVGTGGISSDDPEAVAKLTDKRTDLEQRRDAMKEANKYHKTHKTLAGCPVASDIITEGLSNMRVWGTVYASPFPPYALTNIGARIRQATKRVVQVEAIAEIAASTETIGAATITVNPSENRVLVAFPSRLSLEHYNLMRRGGFVWARTRSAFVRKVSSVAVANARVIATHIAKESEAR